MRTRPAHEPAVGERQSAACLSVWLCVLLAASAHAQASVQVLNGRFEDGLRAWQVTGTVHLETNGPTPSKATAVLGPGPGALRQRIKTGSGNHLTLSATVVSSETNGWILALRFLDRRGRELMKVDSLADIRRSKDEPRKLSHYMKAHPLTEWAEIVITNSSSTGTVRVDDVELDIPDENNASQPPACDLVEELRPFWRGNLIVNEAVLMVSQDGHPAVGRLMFCPSKILSVRDYGLSTNYVPGVDYTVDARNLTCTESSRMTRLRQEDLPKGELAWPTPGGKQVMVTYEHAEPGNEPHPAFAGAQLPQTLKKLQTKAPLAVVAYGDSITHGLGESRLARIPPYLPPWPELFVRALKDLYHDKRIQLYNSAQSGADSNWGRKYAQAMVASLKPDLVIVAFGQNDFWSVSANRFADNIREILKSVRAQNPDTEFLLVSTMRFDPAYTSKADYWDVVGEYARKLQAMAGPGVAYVDMTAISEWVFAAKKPMDCLNDPLHPNDYFARWYAQSLLATLDPTADARPASAADGNREQRTGRAGRTLARPND